ncbi:MAG TPA: serine/threonine-protein kinase, partial [Polyangiaceae bacterium]
MSENLLGTKLGNYRLERLLGRGRMGVVYLAQDEALLRPTAVKVLSWSLPESQGQSPEAWFISEARNVARVNHPNVVQIYSVARHGPHCYIAMEYVDGATADVWIERDGPFLVEQATELLIQTAGALQAAHDANVVHRDIKPENLLVGSDGKAKLGDFGMALHTANARPFNVGRAGTPNYTAPEIWNGDPASPASDIYALGATYFYLLTGHPPYVANELKELATAHLSAEIPEMRTRQGSLPFGCQDIVRRCLAKSPRQRFPSAQAVGWEARALLRKMASVPPPSTTVVNVMLEEAAPLSAPRRGTTPPQVNGSERPRGHWSELLGFAQEPFGRCEPGQMRYRGEPQATLLAQLENLLRDPNGSILLLEGPEGSGRTTLAREFVTRCYAGGACAVISSDGGGPAPSLTKKALRAFGASPGMDASVAHDMDALVEHCLGAKTPQVVPLLVIDDCSSTRRNLEELASVALAAQLTKSFRLLLIVDPNFEASWSRDESLLWKKLTVPPLCVSEVAAYVQAWLTWARRPGAPPILLTPDALLLLAHRSLGVVGNINHILVNMLTAAATEERHVLDSWDTWAGSRGPSDDDSASQRPR